MTEFDSIQGVFAESDARAAAAYEYQSVWNEVVQQYPRLGKHDFKIIAGQGTGYAETYPFYESHNPIPGTNVIEIRNHALDRDQLKSLMAGEALHILGGTDPTTGEPIDQGFRTYKNRFVNSMTADQLTFERMQYRSEDERLGVENRPFDLWFNVSRADAYLRGHMFPVTQEERDDWGSSYTKEQRALLDEAKQYLRQP